MAYKLALMVQIRDYLRRTPVEDLQNEISMITTEENLRILMGAGLRRQLYYQVISQMAKVKNF